MPHLHPMLGLLLLVQLPLVLLLLVQLVLLLLVQLPLVLLLLVQLPLVLLLLVQLPLVRLLLVQLPLVRLLLVQLPPVRLLLLVQLPLVLLPLVQLPLVLLPLVQLPLVLLLLVQLQLALQILPHPRFPGWQQHWQQHNPNQGRKNNRKQPPKPTAAPRGTRLSAQSRARRTCRRPWRQRQREMYCIQQIQRMYISNCTMSNESINAALVRSANSSSQRLCYWCHCPTCMTLQPMCVLPCDMRASQAKSCLPAAVRATTAMAPAAAAACWAHRTCRSSDAQHDLPAYAPCGYPRAGPVKCVEEPLHVLTR